MYSKELLKETLSTIILKLLAERLAESGEPWQVVNASVSGETTAGGLSRLPALLAEHRPSVVLVALGSNDGLRGFGFDHIDANLRAMIAARRLDQRNRASQRARPLLIPRCSCRWFSTCFSVSATNCL